jgi:hypothetical protein
MSLVCTSTNTISKQEHMATPSLNDQPFIDTTRIRKRCKGKPDEVVYASKKADLRELESLSEQGLIDLFYGDESHVSSEGYVPYGWQFPD